VSSFSKIIIAASHAPLVVANNLYKKCHLIKHTHAYNDRAESRIQKEHTYLNETTKKTTQCQWRLQNVEHEKKNLQPFCFNNYSRFHQKNEKQKKKIYNNLPSSLNGIIRW
jgi:predicted  nucleic acid-binding Zn-ribbon protein